MSDNEEGFGLGRGLGALFGDDDAFGAEDEDTSEAQENDVAEGVSEDSKEDVETSDEGDFAMSDENKDILAELNALVNEHDDEDEIENVTESAANSISEEMVVNSSFSITDDEVKPSSISALENRVVNAPEGSRPRYSVAVENLYPGRYQPRRIFAEERLDELADSLRQYGVLQPLLVRQDPSREGEFEIIAGERRWRAAQKAQLHEMPVIVLDLDELEAYKIALIENLQREDLDPIDEAAGYQKLLEDFGQTQDELAKAVGKSRPHITNMIRLLGLPDVVQGHLSVGDLTMGHARALVNAPDAEGLAKQIISKGLSVRQTEKLAANKKGVEQKSRPRGASPAQISKDPDTIALENDMSNALGMRVNIDSADGKSGKLSVEFKSLDQLDELLHRLAHFPGARLSG